MKKDKTLEAIVKRCQGECYVGKVGIDRLIVENGFRK